MREYLYLYIKLKQDVLDTIKTYIVSLTYVCWVLYERTKAISHTYLHNIKRETQTTIERAGERERWGKNEVANRKIHTTIKFFVYLFIRTFYWIWRNNNNNENEINTVGERGRAGEEEIEATSSMEW